MEELQHCDVLRLIRQVDGEQVLLHTITWEFCPLDMERGPWRLVFGATGYARLRDNAGGDCSPNEFFQHKVLIGEAGALHVLTKGGASASALADVRSRKRFGVKLLHVVRDCDEPVVLWHTKFWWFEFPIKGARVLWELRRVQRVLFVESDSEFYLGYKWLHGALRRGDHRSGPRPSPLEAGKEPPPPPPSHTHGLGSFLTASPSECLRVFPARDSCPRARGSVRAA